MLTPPEGTDVEVKPPRAAWHRAAVWTLPVGIWLAACAGTGLGLIASVANWHQEYTDWQGTIESTRQFGDLQGASAQEHAQHQNSMHSAQLCGELAFGFAITLGLAWLYRKKIPSAHRAGWRGVVLALLLLCLLGSGGLYLLGTMLRGAITG